MWHPPLLLPQLVFSSKIPPPMLLQYVNGQFISPLGTRFEGPHPQGCGEPNTVEQKNRYKNAKKHIELHQRPGKCFEFIENEMYDLSQREKGCENLPNAIRFKSQRNEPSVDEMEKLPARHRKLDRGGQLPFQLNVLEEESISSGTNKEKTLISDSGSCHSGILKRSTVSENVVRNTKRTRFNETTKHLKAKKEKHPPGCLFCKDKSHSAQCCTVYPDVDSRIEFLNKNELCHSCVFKGHDAKHCPTYNKKRACRFCKSRHIIAICKTRRSPPNSVSVQLLSTSSSRCQDDAVGDMPNITGCYS